MMNWFESLAQRERLFVSAGGAVLLVALIYAFVWLPLDKGQQSMSASIATWERSLADLQPLSSLQLGNSINGPTAGANSPQTPVVIVDQTLRARGLDNSLKRSQPTTTNGIRIEFENIAFDDLVLWLGDLSTQFGMHVTTGSMSATSQAGPGRINATFTLERN
jgi:general secretion pathway protein M